MKKRAFTLIELLIVVAIIAILAAIAVPNFLEAQTRAKVSRAKADMRTVVTGLEAYAVDSNAYPLAVTLDDRSVFTLESGVEVIESLVPHTLTTPVSYLSSLPRDPFPPRAQDGEGVDPNQPFHYLDLQTAQKRNEPDVLTDYYEKFYGGRSNSSRYWVFTVGPDLDHDEDLAGSTPGMAAALYDPTNGTVSSGDIFYYQGKGF